MKKLFGILLLILSVYIVSPTFAAKQAVNKPGPVMDTTVGDGTDTGSGTTTTGTGTQPSSVSFSCPAKTPGLNTASITVQPSSGDMQPYTVSLYTAQGVQTAAASTTPLSPTPPLTASGASYVYSGLTSNTTYYAVIVGSNLPAQQIPGCSLTTTFAGSTAAGGTGPTVPTGGGYTFGTLGSLPTGAVNTTTTSPTAITATPQTGSSQLAQCSAIKFISILDILIWLKCIIVIAIIPLIFAAAFMFFLWGVMKFIMANDSAKKEEGKKFIIAGMIGLFVMTSIWGIVSIVGHTLGTGNVVPVLQTSSLQHNP